MDRTSDSKYPLVSIITPSFNRRHFIEQCLASVANQSYPNIEHIVVDGGSSDGTIELLETCALTQNLRWVSESDEGMYDAINKGLRMAQGEIIGYLNTDDSYLPWSVEKAVGTLSQGPKVVFGDLVVVKQVGDKKVSYVQFYPPFDPSHYLWVQAIGQPTVFWRREVTDLSGDFSQEYRLIADCDRWLTFAELGFVPFKVDEVLAIQVDHGETLRESHADLLREEFVRLRSCHGNGATEPPLNTERMRMKLRWRRDNFRLLREYRSSEPARWSLFVRFLVDRQIRFNSAYALTGL
ncbi:MAG: glycosyltransferase, partial [Actinobacteria bacterium]|nr:glycosyltransferase [Actinomycetota bacterium]